MPNNIHPTSQIFQSEIGNNVEIREFCTIRNSHLGTGCKVCERTSIKKSQIGDKSEINSGTYIENTVIEEGVEIAPNCCIVGVTHKFSKDDGVSHKDIFKKIYIKKQSWVGAGSIILPGVVIGEGAVIGAGSIVNKNIPKHHVYVGTPLLNKIYPIK